MAFATGPRKDPHRLFPLAMGDIRRVDGADGGGVRAVGRDGPEFRHRFSGRHFDPH